MSTRLVHILVGRGSRGSQPWRGEFGAGPLARHRPTPLVEDSFGRAALARCGSRKASHLSLGDRLAFVTSDWFVITSHGLHAVGWDGFKNDLRHRWAPGTSSATIP